MTYGLHVASQLRSYLYGRTALRGGFKNDFSQEMKASFVINDPRPDEQFLQQTPFYVITLHVKVNIHWSNNFFQNIEPEHKSMASQ